MNGNLHYKTIHYMPTRSEHSYCIESAKELIEELEEEIEKLEEKVERLEAEIEELKKRIIRD